MKKLKLLFCAFVAFAFVVSCAEDDNMAPVGEWELTEPLLEVPNTELELNQGLPNESFEFSWEPAVSSERYQVRYSLVIDTLGSEDFSSPIFSKTSNDGGKATKVALTATEIDLALSYAGFPADEEAAVAVAVIATSIDKQTNNAKEVSFKRFETEHKPQQVFLSGAATEAGSELGSALPLRALENAEGNLTYEFEIYTHLEAGQGFKVYSKQNLPAHVYGGSEGELVKNGEAISVAESGEYRLKVNLEAGTYDLLKIDHISLVGDVIPAGWGGDEPLEYIGNGIWESKLSLLVPDGVQAGFVFRLNGDWGYLLKKVAGSANELYLESEAEAAGETVEDVQLSTAGEHIVTVSLTGDAYTYSLEREQSANPPSETPEALFLLADGEVVATFEKDGDVFRSKVFVPLQASVSYQLNSAEDASGTAYSMTAALGESSNPDGDAVPGNAGLIESDDNMQVARDQAYQLNFDFAAGSVSWKYYNIKLFHWDDAGGGWDDRDEFLMTYVHPLQYTLTEELEAGYDMKFNSPWDVEFGADDPKAMSGGMTHGGTNNFKNITTSGTYTVNIEVENTYATGTYEFLSN